VIYKILIQEVTLPILFETMIQKKTAEIKEVLNKIKLVLEGRLKNVENLLKIANVLSALLTNNFNSESKLKLDSSKSKNLLSLRINYELLKEDIKLLQKVEIK
jgi:hypothetical protein